MREDSKNSKPIGIGVYRHGVKQDDEFIPHKEFTPEKHLRCLIKDLSPRATGYDLIRIGSVNDGGYLVPDDLEGIKACFSPGSEGRIEFEETLAFRYGIEIFIADRLQLKLYEGIKQGIQACFSSGSKGETESIKVSSSSGSKGETKFEETPPSRYNIKVSIPNKSRKLESWKRKIKKCLLTYKVLYLPYVHFTNKYIGLENNRKTIRLQDWIEKRVGQDSTEDLILQMDIEGAEWDALMDTPPEVLKKFRIMVIEFHSMQQLFHLPTFSRVKRVFDKILCDFCVVHIHPNTGSWVRCYQNIEVPSIMEFTFIRKDRILPDNRKLVFPHRLDSASTRHKPDLVLPEIWQNP